MAPCPKRMGKCSLVADAEQAKVGPAGGIKLRG